MAVNLSHLANRGVPEDRVGNKRFQLFLADGVAAKYLITEARCDRNR
jgi:hypothetical protein